ncbi:hypothetical protein AYO41_02025 [Verrucomicrobia bacterium SCGC AG-212-E04]|nr:hypothetical protein AYO41_02025 [Verrucomicrobia bacterium SCGC AG-212-E04]
MHRAVSIFVVLALLVAVRAIQAADGLCARVTLEIPQRLTFERQAFEARMIITNGGAGALTNVTVDLLFTDRNGNPSSVTMSPTDVGNFDFFYRLSGGTTLPASIGENQRVLLTWLIIPTPQIRPTTSDGTLFYVGATLRYQVTGKPEGEVVNVQPDYLVVKPMPDLHLDYFLAELVQADEPNTPDLEGPLPYTLGVRVLNAGAGAARALKLESGNVTVLENRLGLVQRFEFIGCEVNGRAAPVTLLADFGDVAGGQVIAARWSMLSPISGTFSDFHASFHHADDLGGTVTSLLSPPRTHFLVRDVLVDLPGRDAVRDFLAREQPGSGVVRVYESEALLSSPEAVTEVVNAQPSAALTGFTGSTATLTIGRGSGLNAISDTSMVYANVVDPTNGAKVPTAVRSDGKLLAAANLWQTRRWVDSGNGPGQLVFELHVFDCGLPAGSSVNGLTYNIRFQAPTILRPPVLSPMPSDLVLAAGQPFIMVVTAVDTDAGVAPILSADSLPPGATFVRDATQPTQPTSVRNAFSWTPGPGAMATVRFVATGLADPTRQTSRTLRLRVPRANPYDAWKALHPGIGGDGDNPARDGLANLVKYALGLNPSMPVDSGMVLGTDVVDGARYMTLTYTGRTDDPDVHFNVLSSDSPDGGWIIQSNVIERTPGPDGFERVKVRDQVDLGFAPMRYMKLQVTRDPTNP